MSAIVERMGFQLNNISMLLWGSFDFQRKHMLFLFVYCLLQHSGHFLRLCSLNPTSLFTITLPFWSTAYIWILYGFRFLPLYIGFIITSTVFPARACLVMMRS